MLAGRTPDKLAAAAEAIAAEVPAASTEALVVDLSDLGSVRAAGEAAAGLGPLHLLVNNAGIMAPPLRRTGDGLESQMATNHFGPFLLTGLLLDQLAASGDGRVVTLSSQMHRVARSAPVGDPRSQHRYSRWHVYGQTKLANLLFTFELDRRLRQAGTPVRALAAHPGLAGTHLAVNGQLGTTRGRRAAVLDGAVKLVSQSAEAGARPTLMAATADLPGATYVGPSGPGEAVRSAADRRHRTARARRGGAATAVGSQRGDGRARLAAGSASPNRLAAVVHPDQPGPRAEVGRAVTARA